MKVFCYYDIYINCKNIEYIVDKREEMVKTSFEMGIYKTAKFYCTTRNTIKRWRSRYLEGGRANLYDLDKTPLNSPKKTSFDIIDKIDNLVKQKKDKKHFITSTKILKSLGLEDLISYGTCNRYVNKSLGKKAKRKRVKTNGGNLEWKTDLKPFERIQIDVKYLTDIPSLKPYFKKGNDRQLARYEFTFKDVATGAAGVAFASEKSVANSERFLEKVLYKFLSTIEGLDLKNVKIQTDNGCENTNRKRKGPYVGNNKKSIFTIFIENNFKEHITIIPGHCTAQSEVESFHWTIERECLAWDDITDNESLLYYTNNFLEEYNNRNRFKRDYTPKQKIEEFFNQKIELPKAIILD